MHANSKPLLVRRCLRSDHPTGTREDWRAIETAGISPRMRRLRIVTIAVVAVLLAAVGGYVAYWRYVAGRIEDGLVAWQQSEKKHKVEASWQRLRISGFPFAFRVVLDHAELRDASRSPTPQLQLAHLRGSARPWDFDNWHLEAPQGLSAELLPAGGKPAAELTAVAVRGTVSVATTGAVWLWLGLHRLTFTQGARAVPVRSADAWLLLPAKPAASDTDPSFGLAFDLHRVGVPAPPVNFTNMIDELAFGVTVKGALPTGPLPQAAARWRDAGGTIEVESLHLDWSGLGITANGTLALDQKLQPIAAFSGGIEGFGAILEALVAADQLTPEQASLVGIALTSLAKPGPDGKPQISAPFAIQNGKMYLGPARLGAAPHIVWE
jgi:hypothetical protein